MISMVTLFSEHLVCHSAWVIMWCLLCERFGGIYFRRCQQRWFAVYKLAAFNNKDQQLITVFCIRSLVKMKCKHAFVRRCFEYFLKTTGIRWCDAILLAQTLTKLASEDSDESMTDHLPVFFAEKLGRFERLALTVLWFYCKRRHTNLTITLHYVKVSTLEP